MSGDLFNDEIDPAPEITLAEQVQCVAREIKLRERTYPRLIYRGKITRSLAETELRRMRAVLSTLQSLRSSLTKKPHL